MDVLAASTSSMQSVATHLRQQRRSIFKLAQLARVVDSSGPADSSSTVNPDRDSSDQWRRYSQPYHSGAVSSHVYTRLVDIRNSPQPVLAQTFATTAEFSGGSFNVTSSSPESRENQQTKEDIDDKELLLESALQFVNEKGWTNAALLSGAKHIGLSPAATGLLPRGPAELVEYFENKCNMELASMLQSSKAEWQNMRTTQRVKEGLKMRLEMNAPCIDTWAQALSIRAQPRNIPSAVEQLAQITDDVWHAAGDKSTDYNWYTKRGLLAGVYTATELYMLTDYSPGFADTWDVLDRRLKDVMTIGRVMGQMGTSAASLMEQISSGVAQLIPHGNHAKYPRS